MQDTKNLWLSYSRFAHLENLGEDASSTPWYVTATGVYLPADGHYGVFDYLYKVVGLRSDANDEGHLDDALEDFDKATFAFMNSGEEFGSFTFKPEHGGLTYYFRKVEGDF